VYIGAPYDKRLCKFIHENSDCKILLHSCGSIKSLIPIFIESGIDILNPVQISAQNMKPSELNDEFGEKMAFWGGGCNTQEVLWQATPAGVAENVKELTKVFKPGSGFVFNQVHNVMGDVPPENIVAMLDTAYAESAY
jgi:uroporphyrinogen decarboxylase